MSKRNIAFSRPTEPAFLKRIKEQVGYKEGPTVDTKRKELDAARPEDFEDTIEEQPTVVVLKPGDLTAEEADAFQKQVEKETEEKPADLSIPIVFKAPNKNKSGVGAEEKDLDEERCEEPAKKKQKKADNAAESEKSKRTNKSNRTLLSFDDEEDN